MPLTHAVRLQKGVCMSAIHALISLCGSSNSCGANVSILCTTPSSSIQRARKHPLRSAPQCFITFCLFWTAIKSYNHTSRHFLFIPIRPFCHTSSDHPRYSVLTRTYFGFFVPALGYRPSSSSRMFPLSRLFRYSHSAKSKHFMSPSATGRRYVQQWQKFQD